MNERFKSKNRKKENLLIILLTGLMAFSLCACSGASAGSAANNSGNVNISDNLSMENDSVTSEYSDTVSDNESGEETINVNDVNIDGTINSNQNNTESNTNGAENEYIIPTAEAPTMSQEEIITVHPPETKYQLSAERKKEILVAYGKYYTRKTEGNLDSFSPEHWEDRVDLFRQCIDSYDGNEVVTIYSTEFGEDFGFKYYTVGSYTFNFGFIEFGTLQLFIYYNNSEMIDLCDAYSRGIVSDAMLEDIYKKFNMYYTRPQ